MPSSEQDDEYCRRKDKNGREVVRKSLAPHAFNLKGGHDHAIVEDLPSN